MQTMDINFEEEYIQKNGNKKFYIRDEFYQQYAIVMMNISDIPGI